MYFPDDFLGLWRVTAVLRSVDTPLGDEFVQDKRVVTRAQGDVGRPVQYLQRFIRNGEGKVVPDRAYNTTTLSEALAGEGAIESSTWDPDEPNVLRLTLRGGQGVYTRVTKRAEDFPQPDRIDTSEVLEQVLDAASGEGPPRVRQSRCVTKYKWRSVDVAAQAGGPVIVATQVVYDYVNAFEGLSLQLEARGRASVVYTYRLSFERPPPSATGGDA